MPCASSCLLHVLCFAETQYQRESKRDKTDEELFWNICDLWEEESTRDGARGGHEGGPRHHFKWAHPPPSWAPRKAVDALLWPQES